MDAFEVVCEIEPATRPDLTRVRHQIGVLSPIATRAELFSTVHSDVLIVKDLRTYYWRWPRLIVKNDSPARDRRALNKWPKWVDRLRGLGRDTPSLKHGERW